MQDYKKLKVWEKSHEFVLNIYSATCSFPKEEIYGLTSQIRRASVSIPTNIAEGCGRETSADFARFIQISLGSASEVEYLIFLSSELKFLKPNDYENLKKKVEELKMMLTSLINKIRNPK